jgi:nucleoside-diphosphate-sugar epimerase
MRREENLFRHDHAFDCHFLPPRAPRTMIVSVTGATGFIGTRLVKKLVAQGNTVRMLTRSRSRADHLPGSVEVFVGELSSGAGDLSAFVENSDIVYHLAGEISRAEAMRSLHVDGTRALVKAAERRVGHWVQLSSVGAYGPVHEGVVDESRPCAPRGDYETTKAESDRLLQEAADRDAFSCTILRPSIVFGPEMPNRSLYQLISMVARGLFFYIGAPGASANYVYVDNVVDALIACGTLPVAKGRVYNLSDFRTMEQFIGAIAASLGIPAPRLRVPEPPVRWLARTLGWLPGLPLTASRVDALTSRARYSNSRIERELGYLHRISMEDGLRRMAESWREWR